MVFAFTYRHIEAEIKDAANFGLSGSPKAMLQCFRSLDFPQMVAAKHWRRRDPPAS